MDLLSIILRDAIPYLPHPSAILSFDYRTVALVSMVPDICAIRNLSTRVANICRMPSFRTLRLLCKELQSALCSIGCMGFARSLTRSPLDLSISLAPTVVYSERKRPIPERGRFYDFRIVICPMIFRFVRILFFGLAFSRKISPSTSRNEPPNTPAAILFNPSTSRVMPVDANVDVEIPNCGCAGAIPSCTLRIISGAWGITPVFTGAECISAKSPRWPL